jgi:hypothetical protein
MFRRPLVVVSAVCLTVAVALPAASSPPDEDGAPVPQALKGDEAAANKKIRVIYDPNAGEIRSVPVRDDVVLSAPLTKALTHSTEGLQVFDLANGGKGVHLDGRFQHVLMVRVKPDGSLETVCTNHSHAAEKFLRGTSDVGRGGCRAPGQVGRCRSDSPCALFACLPRWPCFR